MLSDQSAYWDGTSDDQEVAQGVYVYMLEVILDDGSHKKYFGDVLMLR